MNSDAPQDRLRLRAQDDDDLAVLSACLQDALVAVRDIAYLPAERRLILSANRFRWEGADSQSERVRCGLVIDQVRTIRKKGIDQTLPGTLLSILALRRRGSDAVAGSEIEILFAGGAAMRISADAIRVQVRDMGAPYPTAWRPHHPLDDPSSGAS
ncbi:MAG: DUF2948 family protein [Alphaproteobacteria bacterium]|nr:DUF2948 family protein [Alphaproteobacteria bacterium]